MPEPVQPHQIVVPPGFPEVLKAYCKAAIKTAPPDLLWWSREYFAALADGRLPPVLMRLEYSPTRRTSGGLTRGILHALAHQLLPMKEVPVSVLQAAWRGFFLDSGELSLILCFCDALARRQSVPALHFVAVAAALLTNNLTQTMMLLCEVASPGEKGVPVEDFLVIYRLLASLDASTETTYINGQKEGEIAQPAWVAEEAHEMVESESSTEARDGVTATVREMLQEYFDENLDAICSEDDAELVSSKVCVVPPVPGIGPVVEPGVVRAVEQWCAEWKGAVMGRDLRRAPPLERLEEESADERKTEEVPTAGLITD